MDEKPWQWLIDEMTNDIQFWVKHGLDKKNPDGFVKIQGTLERVKEKQKQDMQGY